MIVKVTLVLIHFIFRRHCVVPMCFNVDFQTAVVNHYVLFDSVAFLVLSSKGLATPDPILRTVLCL